MSAVVAYGSEADEPIGTPLWRPARSAARSPVRAGRLEREHLHPEFARRAVDVARAFQVQCFRGVPSVDDRCDFAIAKTHQLN